MRPSIKVALLFAGIWFVIKLSFFGLQVLQDPESVKFHVLLNILCLLLAVSIGTLIEKKKENRADSTALGDIKNAMTGGMVYTVVVAGCIYLYYSKIDPAYNERQIFVAEQSILKSLNNPKDLAEIKQQRPEFEVMTNDEIFQSLRKNPRSIFSAGSTMTLSLLGMLVLTTINAIIVTVIYRRVLFKERTL